MRIKSVVLLKMKDAYVKKLYYIYDSSVGSYVDVSSVFEKFTDDVFFCLTLLVTLLIFRLFGKQMFIPQGQHFWKIMKPPQSLPLQMAKRLRRAQPDSVANHVTARSISD